jgi:hypothetical protein
MSIEIVAAVVGAVAAGLSALIPALAQKTAAVSAAFEGRKTEEETGLQARLRETRIALRRQRRLATAYRLAGSLLTFSQVVIGGILTSSFVQQSLSKDLVGILGLIVLAASLVRQYSRPEVLFLGARQRAAQLKALIRDAEDQISFSEEGVQGALPQYKIQKMLTEGLKLVDEAEIRDLEAMAKPLENA